jgi:single-stranded-DNA-specific exonuclease
LSGPELPLLRRLAGELPGAESFLRTALCLEVFAERGLLTLDRTGDALPLRLTAAGKKVELDGNPGLRRLREILN